MTAASRPHQAISLTEAFNVWRAYEMSGSMRRGWRAPAAPAGSRGRLAVSASRNALLPTRRIFVGRVHMTAFWILGADARTKKPKAEGRLNDSQLRRGLVNRCGDTFTSLPGPSTGALRLDFFVVSLRALADTLSSPLRSVAGKSVSVAPRLATIPSGI